MCAYPVLEVLANLVVELQAVLELFQLLLLKVTILNGVFRRRLRRVEEVEERLGGARFAHKTGAIGV